MMRIQIDESGDQITLQVEGRLAGAWAPELEQCWLAAIVDHPGSKISVDLSGVTCVDQAGQYLLRLMRRDGASLVGAGLAIRDTLDEMKCRPQKGD
jgi:anti-anti-sigma regulatory factor